MAGWRVAFLAAGFSTTMSLLGLLTLIVIAALPSAQAVGIEPTTGPRRIAGATGH